MSQAENRGEPKLPGWALRPVGRRPLLKRTARTGAAVVAASVLGSLPVGFSTDRDPRQPTLDARDMSVEQLVARVKEYENRGKITFAMAQTQGRDLTYLFVKSGHTVGLEESTPPQALNDRAESLYQRMVFVPDFELEFSNGKQNVAEDTTLATTYATGDTSIDPESSHLIQWFQKAYPQVYAGMSRKEKIDFLGEVYLWGYSGMQSQGRVMINLAHINTRGSEFTPTYAAWQQLPATSGGYDCLPSNPAVYFRSVLFHETGHEDAYDKGGKDRPMDPDLVAAYQSLVNEPAHIKSRPEALQHPITVTGGVTHNFGILLATSDPKVSINYTGMLEFIDDILSSYKAEKLGFGYVRPGYDTEADYRNMQGMLKDIGMSMKELHDLYYHSQLEPFLFRLGSTLLQATGTTNFSKPDAYKAAIRLFSPEDTDVINWNQIAGDNQLDWKQFPLKGLDTRPYVLAAHPNDYYRIGSFPLELPVPVTCLVPK